MLEDIRLKQRVIDELEFEPAVDATRIGVSVHQGIVTLTGEVENFSQKTHAIEAARRVKGVKGLAPEIRVNIPSHKKTADDEIAARAVKILEWALDPVEPSLQVEVENGHVMLSGEVGWDYQRRHAEECVNRLGGVTGVTNLISIRPSVAPGEVRARIAAALERSADIEANGIIITTAPGGRVVLTGHVRTLHEQIAAENAALSAPGVIDVENHLNVIS